MLYTTFNKLHENNACKEGYKKLAEYLGGVKSYGKDTPIPLTVVLESNGLGDALWCLSATVEDCERSVRLLACDYAEHVLHLFETKYPDDKCPRTAIDVSRRYANGESTIDELAAARDAAWAAARAAAWDAARETERAWQKEKFIEMLNRETELTKEKRYD